MSATRPVPPAGLAARPGPRPVRPQGLRAHYRLLLGWVFTLSSTLRVFAYLPTLVLIWQAQDASQHSLLTWCIWLVGNFSMALWLHETSPGSSGKAVLVSLCNATMCLAAVLLIVWVRMAPGLTAPATG